MLNKKQLFMRRFILLFAFILGGALFTKTFAAQQIPMQIIRDEELGNGNTLAPPRPWYITENDFVLTIPSLGDDYVLELRDENDNVVFTIFFPSGTTMVVIPSNLSGNFEIRLVGDSYYYRGFFYL